MTQILIVEDEHDIADTMARYLQAEGFRTHIIDRGTGVIEWVKKHEPALILLDLMLPGIDGLTLCRKLRQFTDVPVIITTAKVEELDRLRGFDSGADDYVCKPYSARETVARIKVMLRRASPPDKVETGLRLLPDTLELCHGSTCITLTAREFRLLELFYRHPGRVYSREDILSHAYDDDRNVSDRTVDSHIRNLRSKLRQLTLDEALQSVYGAGYKYVPPA